MKTWRVTQAGLQKVMNIPWCAVILKNCHSEWTEIKIIFHPDKKSTKKDTCLLDAAPNPRRSLTVSTDTQKNPSYFWIQKELSAQKQKPIVQYKWHAGLVLFLMKKNS